MFSCVIVETLIFLDLSDKCQQGADNLKLTDEAKLPKVNPWPFQLLLKGKLNAIMTQGIGMRIACPMGIDSWLRVEPDISAQES